MTDQTRATALGRGTAGGISAALHRAFLPDAAADAEFERMIERLRGEPGTTKGGK